MPKKNSCNLPRSRIQFVLTTFMLFLLYFGVFSRSFLFTDTKYSFANGCKTGGKVLG